MTRPEYLNLLAEARQIIDECELAPMTFANSPGKVGTAIRRWNSASHEERTEASTIIASFTE